jgi:hypothetical protein
VSNKRFRACIHPRQCVEMVLAMLRLQLFREASLLQTGHVLVEIGYLDIQVAFKPILVIWRV